MGKRFMEVEVASNNRARFIITNSKKEIKDVAECDLEPAPIDSTLTALGNKHQGLRLLNDTASNEGIDTFDLVIEELATQLTAQQ